MDQVKQMIKACIVSRKGGVPLTELDREYWQLVGTNIPYTKYGFVALQDFIQSISEVQMIHNQDGSIILKTRDSKASHIATLVEQQKTTGNVRKKLFTRNSDFESRNNYVTTSKKVTNSYRMSAPGYNTMHGASSQWKYKNDRGSNLKGSENVTSEPIIQAGYKIPRHRKQEMGQLYALHVENLGKNHMEKEKIATGSVIDTEKHYLRTMYQKNGIRESEGRHPLKMISQHLQQRNNTGGIYTLDDTHDEFNKYEAKLKNHREINVGDTILVTIVNDYCSSSANKRCIHQKKNPSGSWMTIQQKREFQQEQLCRCSRHRGYSQQISAVKQKYRMTPSRQGTPVDHYEELYMQKKWIEDGVNDSTEDLSDDCTRQDSDYSDHNRDIPGLLIKVKNEYAINRRIRAAT